MDKTDREYGSESKLELEQMNKIGNERERERETERQRGRE